MRITILIAFVFTARFALSQTDSLSAVSEIEKFQRELNIEYKDSVTSPLEKKDLKKFKGHSFFPVNLHYRVVAQLTLTPSTPFFGMPTSIHQAQAYRIYGYVTFSISGQSFRIPVYQSKELMKLKEYEDYIFLPFTDLTNGKTTYDGGRYIGLRMPREGNELVIDFNKAYNPYCAYSGRYSCPIVPKENHLEIEIPVGVMYVKK